MFTVGNVNRYIDRYIGRRSISDFGQNENYFEKEQQHDHQRKNGNNTGIQRGSKFPTNVENVT